MIGEKYWSIGIEVYWYGPDSKGQEWGASADFHDDGFCEENASEGTIKARYLGDLSHVVDLVKADAERLGITFFRRPDYQPVIYYKSDGEDGKHIPPPGWRELLRSQAQRLGNGWRTYDWEPEGQEVASAEELAR